jgi:hypothetical protein
LLRRSQIPPLVDPSTFEDIGDARADQCQAVTYVFHLHPSLSLTTYTITTTCYQYSLHNCKQCQCNGMVVNNNSVAYFSDMITKGWVEKYYPKENKATATKLVERIYNGMLYAC